MALGGGTFLTQNKVLPGSYINFISIANGNANLGERGYGAMALELDFFPDDEIVCVTNEDFMKNSLKIFGYSYTDDRLKGLRELFMNMKTLYTYRLNSGVKASNEYCYCKNSGIRGNDLTISVYKNIDDITKFDVSVLLDGEEVDMQTVVDSSDLVDNDFVVWKSGISLDVNAGLPLSGGENGEVTGNSHQTFLDKVEKYTFNIIGCDSSDDIVKSLYYNFTKRMRDEVGVKFQLVVHNLEADYEGVVNVKNEVRDEKYGKEALVYWVSGLLATMDINKSALNKKYSGEFDIDCEYSQSNLKEAINNGEFMLHYVGDDIRVLSDINSLVTITDEKGDIFKDNQTVRVIDEIACSIANIFNTKYLGNVPNDNAGRISLWSDIVKHHENLEKIRAIENFSSKDVVVTQGDDKKSVVVSDNITIINTMAKLYMSVYIG